MADAYFTSCAVAVLHLEQECTSMLQCTNVAASGWCSHDQLQQAFCGISKSKDGCGKGNMLLRFDPTASA